MNRVWTRWALAYGCLLMTSALLFQNCGPAKLSSSGDLASQSVQDSALIGTKVDLNSLMLSPQEPSTNVLFPAATAVNDYDYAVSAPIIENLVLKNNDFTRIEWIHAQTSTVVAVGDSFNQPSFSSDQLGVYYIVGYRGPTSYRLSQFRLISKGTTTLNANSTGAVQLNQQVISSDSLNEDVLVTMDAPAVDLSSVQFNVKSKGLTVTGKRAFLVTKKLAESLDVEMNITDVTGQSASKVLTLAAKSSNPPVASSCTFNGQTLSSGSSITAFQASSVAYGSSCASQVRTCTNGTLSGTYQYASCAVAAPGGCVFAGQTLASGVSVTAFQASSVPYGSTCVSETRSCLNGTLSGSYQNASCSVASPATCSFNGQTLTNGNSVTAYQTSSVPFGSTCTSQTRTCSNGTLSGTYAYSSCTVGAAPANCTFNGQSIASGTGVTAFLASSVPYGSSCTSQTRSCTNGTLSGTYQYSTCSVAPAANCSFNGQTLTSGSSITAYQSSSVPYGSTCTSQVRSCSNGTLSGTYTYGSCSVAAPASCSFNGQTIASGVTITAFQSSSVAYGGTCSSEQRTCSNGSLSGSYQYGSCTVAAPLKTQILMLDAPNQTIVAGNTLTLTLKFNVNPMPENYNLFVAFVDSNGNEASFSAGATPNVPTTQWPTGAYSATMSFAIPSNLPMGTYSIRAGMFRNLAPPNNTRISLDPGPGVVADTSLRYAIGTLNVNPSMNEIFQLSQPNLSVAKGGTLSMNVKFFHVPLNGNYQVFVHLVDSSGVQHSDMNGGAVPTVPSTSFSGLTTYPISINIPSTAPSGTYTIRAGLYLYVSPYTTRATCVMGPGVTVDGETRYTIGTVTIP